VRGNLVEVYVCKNCGRELPKNKYGQVPGKCPYCGGFVGKKVIVLKWWWQK
jgi:DNA-directed RNA polymerase subunit RPC12/RpoP